MQSISSPTVAALRSASLFDGLRARQLRQLATKVEHVTVEESTVLIREGSMNRHAYVIAEGEAIVTVGDATVARVTAGGVVGERSAVTHDLANATVTTDGPATLLIIDHRALLGLAYQAPQLHQKLLSLVATRDEQLAA